MKTYKGISTALIAAMIAATAAGCSGGNTQESDSTAVSTTAQSEAQESESTPESQSETEAAASLPEGQMYSFLTGEPVDSSIGMQRPVAVMINNIEEATSQQCGTSAADILYEAVVEGNITRLMAIFQDTSKIERVGSVRSARHNYLDFASNYDAIYCHYGQSIYATNKIQQEGLLTVSENVGSAYFQDNTYPAPHHIFASGETLEAGISQIGAGRNLPDGYEGGLVFNTEDTDPDYGTIANNVSIPFVYSKSTLEYDSATKLYKKYQYGAPHVDANNNEQLTFKNIIIQYAQYADIPGGSGCQDITLYGEGKGIYITDGKAVDITWERSDGSVPTTYYIEDGTQLKINPGKTYIAVVPENFNITLGE
ncbi:DUF3048 domain-containing protein [Catenibacillus scindens]|uniref:DUF3048 domain-containing protein n=1 Tax=Catenibacillus scindens TaxID=673271 RepID=UPI00320B934A